MTADRSDVLIALSHLRWDWVWQRPQHLISRIGEPGSTFFVEEPRPYDGDAPRPGRVSGGVTRLWLDVPSGDRWIGFHEVDPDAYVRLVEDAIGRARGRRIVWMYTALALDVAQALSPDVLVYDVMDDLAAFAGAAPEQAFRHHAALHHADVVFTGGRSLHAAAASRRAADIHCFPSGVELEHFAPAAEQRARRTAAAAGPIAGYVGVLDERIDWGLVGAVADALPMWTFLFVGPVAKVDPDVLPVRTNIHYTGPRSYAQLPDVMASFDVALMPFARNEATRSISPTKTLEYLAAGLPVVSTAIADVVADHGPVVSIADDAVEFAAACTRSLHRPPRRHIAATLREHHWDTIAAQMSSIIDEHAMNDGRQTAALG
jgi:glycosyltransferase involved in cell wall biosynthesis